VSELKRYGHENLRQAIAAVFRAGKADAATARAVGDMLVEANLSGHDSHGIQMVSYYVDCLNNGTLDPAGRAELVLDGGAVMRFDGHMGFGAVVGAATMKGGIERARDHGIALVATANSHHLGRIGHWAEMCLREGLVSLHFVNVHGHQPLVAPWGGMRARMGTNPFCAGVPATDRHPPFVLDFATSKIAFGKVHVANDKGVPLPPGAMIDAQGNPTLDPATMIPDATGGSLLTMGDHKGFGLSILCELLGGALSGGGANRPERITQDTTVNGMLSILIDPAALGGFASVAGEIDALYDWVVSAPPVPGTDCVILAGEPERRARAERLEAGIPLADQAFANFVAAGGRVGVAAATLESLAGA